MADLQRSEITSALTPRELLMVAAIAERVADLLRGEPRVGLVDAATLAAELGVSRDFVYAHADELGGRRIGGGSRGRLRFDLGQALAAWASRPASQKPREPQRPGCERTPARRRRRTGSDCAGLLPIRGAATTSEDREES